MSNDIDGKTLHEAIVRLERVSTELDALRREMEILFKQIHPIVEANRRDIDNLAAKVAKHDVIIFIMSSIITAITVSVIMGIIG